MAWPHKIFAATTIRGVYYTDDFSDPAIQPTWTAVNTGLPALDCKEFDLDPFDEVNRQYVLLDANRTIYRCEFGGNWESILTSSQARTICGKSGGTTVRIRSFCADLTVAGRLWALFQWDNYTYAIRSDDYGDNWAGVLVTSTNTEDVRSIRSNGNYVWVVTYAGTLFLHNDWTFYSSNAGNSWNLYYNWDGHQVLINPLTPTDAYLRTGVTGSFNLTRLTSGGVGTDLQLGIPPTRQDSMWFDYIDPDHHRLLHIVNQKMYVTTDDWATKSDGGVITPIPISFAPWAGADMDQMLVGLSAAGPPGIYHVIGALYGEADTTVTGIAGINVNTPPYTDAIPYSAYNAPCQRGIRALQPTVGKINTYAVAMPGIADTEMDRGVPIPGDRSAFDAKNYPLRHANDIDEGIHWTANALANLPLADHDHSGDIGDGGQFDLDHLLSMGAAAGDIPTADGAGGISWETPGGPTASVGFDYSEINIGNPPDEDDLIAAFGSPSTDARARGHIINDNGDGEHFYIALADGNHWWLAPLAKTLPPSAPSVVVDSTTVLRTDATQWFGRASMKIKNNIVIMVYREGSAHNVNDGELHIKFSGDYGDTWSDEDEDLNGNPIVGFPMNPPISAGQDAGEPWLYIDPNGDLLIHMWRIDYGVSMGGSYQSRSTDNGLSWSTPTQIDFIGEADDTIVFSTDDDFVYNDVIYAGARVYTGGADGVPSKMILIKSADDGVTWEEISIIMDDDEGVEGTGGQEVGLEYLGNNTIIAMLRDNAQTHSYKRVSTDMGLNWGSLTDMNSTVGIAGRQRIYTRSHLHGGANWWQDKVLIMVGFIHTISGDSLHRRNAIWISLDAGVTWSTPFYVDTMNDDGGYGDIIYNPLTGQYVVVSYKGTLAQADLIQYDLSIGGI